ncbi:glycosyltransferase [Weissella muntiaci]|uniref:Glycosyltransferase n=1 Tax=Weissella muntiaci TaxID=2508881 RepID=A0A6C2C3N4_9LACO|nr:glycosyltransferase family 2 protein [Weissella muntiaci]TYC47845.1 glycosyltransferase [Weissella muntiaci]
MIIIDLLKNMFIFIVVFYPIIGGLLFIFLSFFYWLFMEKIDKPQYLKEEPPFISILVAAHNEELTIESTINHLERRMNYPTDKYEVIVVDDGSTDRTKDILLRLQKLYANRLRVIKIVNNRGKAAGLNIALGFAKGEFVLSNDADSKPEIDALWKYMYYFERKGGKKLGAVTGNMLPINKTTIVSEAQQNELNSIIGLIKRAQLSFGGLFAFSGANTMYRKQAVLDVGGWQAEQPTEDIAISWDMQIAGWKAFFAPHIRFYMDVPETLRDLIKQRKRWTSGGLYVLLTKSFSVFRSPRRNFALIPIIIDYALSIVWSFFFWISLLVYVIIQITCLLNNDWSIFTSNLYFASMIVIIEIIVGLVQLMMASYFNDGGKSLKYIIFAPWYILIYWMVNAYTVLTETIPTIKKIIEGENGGVWTSPKRSKDRGLEQ